MSFRGIWLDAAILADDRLSHSERLVYAFMSGFPSFHASDAHIAATLHLTPKTVANAIQGLRKHGLIEGTHTNRQPIRLPKNG
jgi:Mn-dependent DtxR family transcriptional regulator